MARFLQELRFMSPGSRRDAQSSNGLSASSIVSHSAFVL